MDYNILILWLNLFLHGQWSAGTIGSISNICRILTKYNLNPSWSCTIQNINHKTKQFVSFYQNINHKTKQFISFYHRSIQQSIYVAMSVGRMHILHILMYLPKKDLSFPKKRLKLVAISKQDEIYKTIKTNKPYSRCWTKNVSQGETSTVKTSNWY
jgi:hypothetical protein